MLRTHGGGIAELYLARLGMGKVRIAMFCGGFDAYSLDGLGQSDVRRCDGVA